MPLRMLMSRAPRAAPAAIDTVAIRLVGDWIVVAVTVTPAPRLTRVPAANAALGEPAIGTASTEAPGAPDVASGSASVTYSIDLPALVS